ncbi:MAG TPA: hypothetical protein VL172_01345, partial [Kofleriaceae bacterium]|nr:hypothetical protein [Kofleriaceae bacterium]
LHRSAAQELGHVGFLLPSDTDLGAVDAAAGAVGLDIRSVFPSAIVARELGALLGRDQVRTDIVQLWGGGRRYPTVEMFVPQGEPAAAARWIRQGVGTHVAFRVGSREALLALHQSLASHAELMPAFMQRRPMENRASGATVLYYDAAGLRVELYHEPAEWPQ